jgi:glycosyltransferase involved in cell wall biosynthesis
MFVTSRSTGGSLSDLNSLKDELERLTVELNAAKSSLNEIRSSRLWRFTEPLRWAVRLNFNFFRVAKHLINICGSPKYVFSTAFFILKDRGLLGLWQAGVALFSENLVNTASNSSTNYQLWLESFPTNGHEDKAQIEIWKKTTPDVLPLISILMPVYKPKLKDLDAAIKSIINQTYENWELCICDDGSSDFEVDSLLAHFKNLDARIKVTKSPTNEHISSATNKAATLATGEYLAFIDQDDLLPENALFEVANYILLRPELKFIYSDEDKIRSNGHRQDPHFKPDLAYEISLTYNVYSHFSVIATELFKELGGLRKGYEGAQDWDLALRAIDAIGTHNLNEVAHIPKVLYHWRLTPTSTSTGSQNKPYAFESGLRAVSDHLARIGVSAEIIENPLLPQTLKVCYKVPESEPSVNIIIPTRDGLDVLKPCVDSILEKSTYRNFRITIVDNGSVKKETVNYLKSLPEAKVKIIRDDSPFNYSSLNNKAVTQFESDYVCLVNNDIEIISPDWLEELVSIASQPGNGAVGPMLWYPDWTVQHAGVVIGIGGHMSVAGHWQKRSPKGEPGYQGRLAVRQNYSAVTGACLLVKRETYLKVGGLDSELKVAFNDVDLCLKIQSTGLRNVWTPFVEMIHHESVSRGYDDSPEKIARASQEVLLMRERWSHIINNDPCFNPNLSLWSEDFGYALPPRNAR